MIDENINYKQAIVQLRNQITLSGRPSRELDTIIQEIDVPLWSISLDVSLLEKIQQAVNTTQKKSRLELEKLLGDIG
jgi:hypothetical protein